MKNKESTKASLSKRILFALKILIQNACGWTTVLILIALISSLSVLFQIKSLEKIINLIVSNKMNDLPIAILIWGISFLLLNLFSLSRKYIEIHINEKMEKRMIPRIIQKYSMLDYATYEQKENQDLFQFVDAYSHRVITVLVSIFVSIASAIVTIIGYLIIFYQASFILGVVAIVLCIPVFAMCFKASYIEMRQQWTMTKDIRKRYYFQRLFADKNALQEIKSFNSGKYFINESDRLTEIINSDMKRNLGKVGRLKIYIEFLCCAFLLFTMLWITKLLLSGDVLLGSFVIVIESVSIFTGLVLNISEDCSQIVRISENVGYIIRFIELKDGKNVQAKAEYSGNEGYAIVFDHVSFSYPDGKKVLEDVSFKIKKGESISFVGENGCGKSTVVKLLCGLYTPDSGRIFIEDTPIDELTNDQLRKKLMVVFQDAVSYQLTLRENVAFGNIEYIKHDSKICEALRIVGAENLISDTKGLDYDLGYIQENSVDISGGEWQRVSISRAFLSDADLLVFDEPTAALDPIAEAKLYKSIYNVIEKKKKTAILISHRLASGRYADRILVMANGNIVEEGTHDELIKKNGLYCDMFEKQSSWYR